ncbi:MAG TPA: serine hydrolase domain-containing protein [Longimicrobium sp.]|jgi:CubicO group peptidase (beta-lactamase class C family)
MGPKRHHDPRTVLIAAAAALISFSGALFGSAAPEVAAPAAQATVRALSPVHVSLRRAASVEREASARTALAPGPLETAEAAVRAQVAAGAFPGAALAIGREDNSVVEKGIGRLAWGRGMPAVDPARTVYDLASLTKVVATTTAVMLLYEDGKIDLDAPVSKYLPEFGGGGQRGEVTVRHLLTHTSGLPAGAEAWGARDAALERVVRTPLVRAPGEAVEYSDVGFIVLWEAAGRAAREPLFRLLDRRVYGPLKMRSTTYVPGRNCVTCAPTWVDGGAAVRGVVHDPTARKLGGIAGNAGLFSTAHDLGRFAAMLAHGGELDGVRVLKEETIARFTRPQPGAGKRALGWDTPGPVGAGGAGLRISKRAFGHTGFTGTSLWIDPERGTWTVLLANRTYEPQAPNRIMSLRRKVNDQVATAADVIDDSLAALAD